MAPEGSAGGTGTFFGGSGGLLLASTASGALKTINSSSRWSVFIGHLVLFRRSSRQHWGRFRTRRGAGRSGHVLGIGAVIARERDQRSTEQSEEENQRERFHTNSVLMMAENSYAVNLNIRRLAAWLAVAKFCESETRLAHCPSRCLCFERDCVASILPL